MSSTLRIVTIITILLTNLFQASAQDTLQQETNPLPESRLKRSSRNVYKLNYRHLIAPTVFIGFGIVSLESDGLKELNSSTRYEIGEHQPTPTALDNYTQY